MVLAITVVLGVSADLLTKHIAFERLASRPVAIDPDLVLARLEHRIPLNERGPLDPALLVQNGFDVNDLPPQAFAEIIPHHEPTTAVPSVLDFTLVLNPGAVFGTGAGKRGLFAVFTVFAVGAALWLFATQLSARDRVSQAAVALVVAGGLGNLYDRIRYACVRDFLNFFPGTELPFGLAWPNGSPDLWPWVSNIADKLLIVGIALLLIKLWRVPRPHETGSGAEVDAPTSGPGAPASDQ